MFGLIGMIIVGGIIGWIAGLILGKDVPGGILGNIIRFNYFNLYYFINFKSTKKKIISID